MRVPVRGVELRSCDANNDDGGRRSRWGAKGGPSGRAEEGEGYACEEDDGESNLQRVPHLRCSHMVRP